MQFQQISSAFRKGIAASLSLAFVVWATPASAATPMISAKGDYACALGGNGSIQCWGDNFHGQLGDGSFTESAAPVAVTGINNAVSVDTGSAYTCAVLSTGAVQCWGYGYHDIAGQGNDKDSAIPITINGVSNATAVAVGGGFTCALLSTGAVQCWGANDQGQLGNGSTARSEVPVTVSGISNATSVAAGYAHACARLGNGSVRCWGANRSWPNPTPIGQLGDGSSSLLSTTPVSVNNLSAATAVTAAHNHTCALLSSGAVQCWGDNFLGQLGNGSAIDSNSPVTVSGISTATSIQTGEGGTCATLANGSAQCWGSGYRGALGNGSSTYSSSTIPVTVSNINNATAVAVGSGHACALLSTGAVQCWGDNGYSQIGKPATSVSFTEAPVAVAGLALGASGLSADADKVFDWAERTFPQYFSPGGSSSASKSGFRLRYYSGTNSFLGVNETGTPHFYYLGPVSGNTVVDLGLLSDWVVRATP